jgi:DNA-directed RNA polymerase subunit RPC12/RpoP
MNTSDEIRCPKCGSNQLAANKKGFSGKKAVAGAILTGGIGLLAGTIGSNKIIITCLNCGNQFKPGEKKAEPTPKMIWDEQLKEHIINPKFKNDTVSAPLWKVLLILIFIIVIIYFLIRIS